MDNRRQFFNSVISTAMGLAGLTACQDEIEVSHTSDTSSASGIDRQSLDAVVDAFVPRDQDPGAVEAGVTDLLIKLCNENEDYRQHAVALLARVDVVAQHKYRKPFHQLGLARREEIITKTLHSRREDDQLARHAIVFLRGYVIEAFYLSLTGKIMLGYTPPYPNGYPDYFLSPAKSDCI